VQGTNVRKKIIILLVALFIFSYYLYYKSQQPHVFIDSKVVSLGDNISGYPGILWKVQLTSYNPKANMVSGVFYEEPGKMISFPGDTSASPNVTSIRANISAYCNNFSYYISDADWYSGRKIIHYGSISSAYEEYKPDTPAGLAVKYLCTTAQG
jgi:hypothetical protein